MRVLFVQQDHVSPLGPVGDAFRRRGFDVEELLIVPEHRFHAPDVTVRFSDPSDYEVIVAMGAPWSVYDEDTIGSWVSTEIAFLRTAHEAGVAILGICFGAQALAAGLGGSVVRAERPEIGWTIVDTDRPDLVEPGPWFEWHGDRWVLPPHVAAFARTAIAEQAFTVGRSLGVQFHPELTPSMLNGWLANGGAAHVRALGHDPDAMVLGAALHAGESADRADRLVDRFLRHTATVVEPAVTPAGGALG